jgi:hypothetical protein
LIAFELFERLKIQTYYKDYKLLYNPIDRFFLCLDDNGKQSVFETLCEMSFHRGSQVDYKKKWMQLRLLKDKICYRIFFDNKNKEEIKYDCDLTHAEIFSTLFKPTFLIDDDDQIRDLSECSTC